jgi:predicted nucleotidyltransferase
MSADERAAIDALRTAGAAFALVFGSRARGDERSPARVRWVADTRKIWLDERPRFERSHREFLEAARGR